VLYFIRKPKDLLKPFRVIVAAANRIVELEVLQARSYSRISNKGVTSDKLAGTTVNKDFTLRIPQGTRISISNENRSEKTHLPRVRDGIPTKIEVTIPTMEEVPELPPGWMPVSLIYDINGVTNRVKHGIKLDKPALLIIKYNEKALTAGSEGIGSGDFAYPAPWRDSPLMSQSNIKRAVFSHDYKSGWVKLETPADFIAVGPEIAAEVTHFSLFVVLAKIEKEVPIHTGDSGSK
jgi:hypothetical protein